MVDRGVKHATVIDWDDPKKAFKLNRQDMKTFLGTNRDIRILELHKRLKGRIPLMQCAEWISRGIDIQRTVRAAKKWNIPLEKLVRYLDGYVGCAQYGGMSSLSSALRFWEDYLTAAEDEARGLRQETERLREELADQAQVYKAKLTAADVETTEANRKAREAQEALDKQREKAQRLQDALSEANTSAQVAEGEHARLTQELEELRNRPAEADTAAVEAARQAAIAEMTEKVDKAKDAKEKAEEKRKAAEESLEAAQKELADLKAKGPEVRELTQEEKDALTASAVERARAEDVERLQGLEKKLAAADPNVAEFKVRFTSWQEEYQKMVEVLVRIAQASEERANKLRQAVKAALEQMATS